MIINPSQLVDAPTTAGAWVVRPEPNPAARLRLFCFPHAGAGAALFRAWPKGLPQSVDLCAVRPPGRESRLREAAFTRLSDLVSAALSALRPYLDIPFAFFGHSLGALVCFELARHLRKETGLGPSHLFVAARRAPQRPEPNPPIRHLSDLDFIEEVRRRFNGIPDMVLKESALIELMLPTLRADFAILETYEYVDDDPLGCPISCFGGLQDRESSCQDLAAWQEQTRGPFSLRMMPGDHFFLQGAHQLLLQALSQDLAGAGDRDR